MSSLNLEIIRQSIPSCNLCHRLRNHCTEIATTKRRAYLNETYWGKPVPGFGDPDAELVIIGLAPGAHGANRTGRVFTGDRSGEWLYRALHTAGFSNQPTSVSKDDGLVLLNAFITCVVKCAPPDNKPLPHEQKQCFPYLRQESQSLPRARVWIALGQFALKGIWPLLQNASPPPQFKHGAKIQLDPQRWLLLSYHPSQQNTFTGKLTEPLFDSVFSEAKRLLSL